MSSFTSPEVPSCAKCNSCKAVFTSTEVVKEHYKSDWHIFNSKRRANNLAPLSLPDFRKVSPSLKKTNASKAPVTAGERNPIKSIGSTEADLTGTVVKAAYLDAHVSTEYKDLAIKLGLNSERIDDVVKLALQESSDDISSSMVDEKEVEGDEKMVESEVEPEPEIITPNVSIFDNQAFETMEECLRYMELTFGFFIPDREYVVDLEGMLTYLGEKVKLGGICLYCQKQLAPGRPCQNHMMNKSHCKIAYEDDIDMDEYEDFYDFSSSYGDEEMGEDGSLVGRTLEISPIGELVLLDGRTVGHRDLKMYYKQHFRPTDARPSILAQKREELLRLEAMFGAVKMDPAVIERLSDAQVVAMIRKEHREQRRALVIGERQQQKAHFKNQRREYKSTVDALRSSQNTTAKIRDYHSMIM